MLFLIDSKIWENIFPFFCFILLVPFSSCDSDSPKFVDDNDYPIYDFSPVELCISIVDERGNSLLDESSENNIVGTPISFSDEKEVYPVDWAYYKKNSRYCMPIFFGAMYRPILVWNGVHWDFSDEWEIGFGQLDGAEDFDCTIKAEACGQEFELRVTNKIEWGNKRPIITRKYYLDGKELDDNRYFLVIKEANLQ